jgi:hypothetical protein
MELMMGKKGAWRRRRGNIYYKETSEKRSLVHFDDDQAPFKLYFFFC